MTKRVIKNIKLDDSAEKELKKRREELFEYYKEKCGYQEIKRAETREVERVSVEENKRKWGYQSLHSLLPQRQIIIKHALPLKILAFSDYRVHDVKQLIEYVRRSHVKPDLIVYAGDDIRRFGPTPLEYLTLPEYEHPKAIQPAELSYSNHFSRSPQYGFILCLQKSQEDKIKEKLSNILNMLYLISQAIKERKLTSVESLKNLIQTLPLQLKVEVRNTGLEPTLKEISIMEEPYGVEITTVMMDERRGEAYLSPLSLKTFHLTYNDAKLEQIEYTKIRTRKKYVYYYLPPLKQSKTNVFEELSNYARYGLVAVIGNDDDIVARAWIRGKNVFDLHSSLVKIGTIFIVGLEGSTCGLGPSGKYLESDVKLRLEFVQKKVGNMEKILIVSHTPPKGVLDRALRFGDEAIGSVALRDFLEEERRVNLVICGHVHRCGGQHSKVNDAIVVNVSSHDDAFSRANVAWITIDREGNAHIEMDQLPSLIEQIIENKLDTENRLISECGLSKTDARRFIEIYKKYGQKFFDHLSDIKEIKFRYGLPWDLCLMLYENGITSLDQVTEEAYTELSRNVRGIYKVHYKRAYAKFKREHAKGEVYLLQPMPLRPDSKVIIFDTEYNMEVGVLYGFLDLLTNKIEQFWFDEKDKASRYVASKDEEGYIFVHWGGWDRGLLAKELGQHPLTLNLLYFCQTSLVAPISSTSLRDVHDALCGHIHDGWWEIFFYGMDGLAKLAMCNRLVNDPKDEPTRKALLETNKADIMALKNIYEMLTRLSFPK